MTFPKRGVTARDKRTGQVVRITEEGMDGASWMVRTVYKSDGYWTRTADLEPARDPHVWGRAELVKLAVTLAVMGLGVYGAATRMSQAGITPWDTLLYCMAVGYTAGAGMVRLLGLYRP